MFLLGGLAVLFGAGAAAAASTDYGDACILLREMGGVFRTLRTLAFGGAAFVIASWAWGFITTPDSVKPDEVKKKVVPMLVGFVMLLGLGTIMQFLPQISQCGDLRW